MLLDLINKKLTKRNEDFNFRSLKKIEKFNEYLDFSSNDYLQLSKDKDVIENSILYTKKYGTSSSSSRLLNLSDLYEELENLIKNVKKTESVTIFPSGYQTNIMAVKSILDLFKNDEIDIFSDKLNHASINYGIELSGKRHKRYKNCDLNHLEDFLKKSNKKNKIVFTESVFGMDGSVVNIENIIELKKKYDFLIYLDEAHSFGLYGENGYGFSSKYSEFIEFSMGTLSKAIGSQGGYIACSKKISDYLINFCSGFIHSTGLNPASVGSSIEAIKKLPKLNNERENLFKISSYLRSKLESNWLTSSTSNIIPIIINSNEEIEKISEKLLISKIIIPKIKYPTVHINYPRFRISINSSHSKKDIDEVISVLKDE